MKEKRFSTKTKILAAKSLAQRIGYLRLQLPDLPIETFNAHKIIRPQDQLFIIKKGTVEIWQTRNDMLVTELRQDSIFGDIPLLGQTMLGTQAIAGSGGVDLGVMDSGQIAEWVNSNPISILQEIGPRFARLQADFYRAQFYTVDSRLASLLLDLAGNDSVITGLTHMELGDQLGTYRETITMSLRDLKKAKLIGIGRKRITILNKKGLRELSQL
jgi:CRP/FNR family transcriptional regulator, cyclic AMP receptor protein